MAVWKSAFLHEFLDGNPHNFHAVPGTLDVLPPTGIGPTPDPELRGFPISPTQSMVYRFARPFDEVIGIDLHVDLRFPLQPGIQDFPLVSLGGGQVTLSMGHLEFIDPGFTPLTGKCRIGLRVGGALVEFNELTVFHQRTTSFHVRWHTHGQAQLSHDGVLRAYQPSFAEGQAFGIDRLTIGGITPGSSITPRFLARRVYLKLLRRQDARDEIDQHVPLDTYGLPHSRCVKTIRGLQDDLQARCRTFMAGIVAQLTQPWREGQSGGPFSPDAVRAHAAAVAAAKAFGTFLDTRAPAAADAFLQHIGEFLDVLAAADPARYAQLLADLSARAETVSPDCRKALAPLYEANAKTLDPLKALLEATWARARSTAAAGGPHA